VLGALLSDLIERTRPRNDLAPQLLELLLDLVALVRLLLQVSSQALRLLGRGVRLALCGVRRLDLLRGPAPCRLVSSRLQCSLLPLQLLDLLLELEDVLVVRLLLLGLECGVELSLCGFYLGLGFRLDLRVLCLRLLRLLRDDPCALLVDLLDEGVLRDLQVLLLRRLGVVQGFLCVLGLLATQCATLGMEVLRPEALHMNLPRGSTEKAEKSSSSPGSEMLAAVKSSRLKVVVSSAAALEAEMAAAMLEAGRSARLDAEMADAIEAEMADAMSTSGSLRG